MRRGVGPVVAPRPVLELLKEPRYDTISIAGAATQGTFYANPLGQIDATALTGVKSFSETNQLRAGALSTPQMFDIYAVSQKLLPNVTRADITLHLNRGNFWLFIGQKSYLRVKMTVIPSDIGLVGSDLAAGAGLEIYTNGLSDVNNVFDVTIPEELLDAGSGRVFLTGRRVPIHLPSEQQFSVTFEYPNTLGVAVTPQRTECLMWGILKREVQ